MLRGCPVRGHGTSVFVQFEKRSAGRKNRNVLSIWIDAMAQLLETELAAVHNAARFQIAHPHFEMGNTCQHEYSSLPL